MLLMPVATVAKVLSSSVSGGLPHAIPQRVVSLNLCADEMLLALADPAQITSVSWLSHDPTLTWDASIASMYPPNRGGVEELLYFEPDLVVTGRYTTIMTQNMLREMEVPVLQLDLPTSLEDAIEQIALVARALGQEPRGEALIARLQQAAKPTQRTPADAVVYYPNGLATGAGTLVDSVLRHAGFNNLAAQFGVGAFSRFPLEDLLMAEPDFLILPQSNLQRPSLAETLLQHPALLRVFADQTDGSQARRVTIPNQAWSCGTGHLIEAFSMLGQLGRTH